MIRGLFQSCSRVVRGLFQSCSGIVPELLFGVGSRVVVRGLFQSCSGLVPEAVWANSRYTHLEFCRHTFHFSLDVHLRYGSLLPINIYHTYDGHDIPMCVESEYGRRRSKRSIITQYDDDKTV